MLTSSRYLSEEHHKASLILLFQFALALMLWLVDGLYVLDRVNILYFLKLFALFVFYNFYYRALKNLNYSFWTFVFIVVVLSLHGLIFPPKGEVKHLIFNIHLLIVLLGLLLGYIMSSPVFFPRVQWWEYDFRYRGDLKILVKTESGKVVDGRLTDLRRGAGCIVMFEQVPIGQMLEILFKVNDEEQEYRCRVISKREFSVGRGINYGVRFLFEGGVEKKNFITFAKDWEKSKKVKLRKKFDGQ